MRRLSYFAVLAEELHFRRAAERLHVSQPGLSQQIRVLERELKVSLFDRSSSGVALTKAGRTLVAEGLPLLQEIERVSADVRAAAAGRSGVLRIVHARSLTDGPPDDLVRRFKRLRPDVEVHVETAWTARNISTLRSAEADAVFVRLPLVESAGISVLHLGRTELAVALPQSDPLASQELIRLENLGGRAVVSCLREHAPGYFDHMRSTVWGGNAPFVTTAEPDPEHVLAAVAEGVGIAVLDSARAVKLCPEGVVVRKFAAPEPTAEFGLAWSPHRMSPVLEAFVTMCMGSHRQEMSLHSA